MHQGQQGQRPQLHDREAQAEEHVRQPGGVERVQGQPVQGQGLQRECLRGAQEAQWQVCRTGTVSDVVQQSLSALVQPPQKLQGAPPIGFERQTESGPGQGAGQAKAPDSPQEALSRLLMHMS